MIDRAAGPGRGPESPAPVSRAGQLQPLRRVFHAAAGLVLAWGPSALEIDHTLLLVTLGSLFVVLIVFDLVRLRTRWLNTLFLRSLPSLASSREAVGVASSTWYVLGVFLTYLLFPPTAAVPAILVLALADPAASVVGRTWGRTRVGTGTVEGTLAFFVVASALLWGFYGAMGLAVALVVSLAEPLPLRLDDNLVIPVLTAGGLFVVGF